MRLWEGQAAYVFAIAHNNLRRSWYYLAFVLCSGCAALDALDGSWA
ncbi:hypothetical protein RJ80_gp46 [Vibrio phage phi-A318]|uniref:Uncharacterized protein n=1 Tax=Vibrio phage phi-A318 TaxID=1151014 RepID=A0A067YBK4_9CAUD|nr:hypothetical protein RJ80_gp46 [Vibrio phage phi-A318]AGZ17773.1 hypothetical protein [Vibrio phage phi-A318]